MEAATSFSPILPAAATTASADPTAAAGQPSPSDVTAVGSYLYAKLNYLFRCHPGIDELGLVLSVPPAGGKAGKKAAEGESPTAASASTSNSSDSLVDLNSCARFDHLHAAPAALVALQSSNCAPFVVMEGAKLGIAFWCIPLLVRFTMLRFQKLRRKLRECKYSAEQMSKLCEAAVSGVDGNAEDILAGVSASPEIPLPLPVDLACCTRVLLLINADNYTAWNIRKQLLSMPAISLPPSSTVSSASASPSPVRLSLLSPSLELNFLNLVYSKHPKSGESWSHRRWVLSRIKGYESKYHFNDETRPQKEGEEAAANIAASAAHAAPDASAPASSLYSSTLFQSELSMCERSAERYPKNYYAWMHRAWLIELVSSGNGASSNDNRNIHSALQSELSRIGEWTESHINDYCGFFHRNIVWNAMLRSLEILGVAQQTPDESSRKLSKGEQFAMVHTNLRARMRNWSKRFPSYTRTETQDSAGSATDAPAAAAAAAAAVVVVVSPAPSSSSSPSVSSSPTSATSALHVALASCSFCSVFSAVEWSHLNELQLKYPGHESLWMYRRFVWSIYIEAIAQHAEKGPEGTTTAAFAAAASSPSPSIPSWLLPLAHRELSYADYQIADRELSNYSDNARFATLYKVWIVHAALTLVYRQTILKAENKSAASDDDAATTFPLLPHLLPAHRTWYLTTLQAVNRLNPATMQRNHWTERTKAANDMYTGQTKA